MLAALTEHGVNQQMSLAELQLRLADDSEGMPHAGMLNKQVKLLKSFGILGMEESAREPSAQHCWVLEGDVFHELSELAGRVEDSLRA